MTVFLSSGAWTDDEIDRLIDSYLAMLLREVSGEPFVKRRFNLELQEHVRRSHAAIEFKYGNLSAVLRDLGRRYINGYKPRAHYQASLRTLAEKRINEFPMAMTQHQSETGTGFPEFWAQIQQLWDRSTGGGDVAAKPEASDADEEKPTAPRPPGVDEACNWFGEGMSAGGLPRFLMLVGGPGAGKSHAASALVKGLTKVSPPDDGLAHRRYTYSTGANRVTLINDATIPSDEHERQPLCHEIDEIVQNADHQLIACVNRGILVEEANAIAGKDAAELSAGEAILTWLNSDPSGTQHGQSWTVESQQRLDYVMSGLLLDAGSPKAQILVVFVDVCSLLERRPEMFFEGSTEGDRLAAGTYEISDVGQRLSWQDDACPAGSLLAQVVNDLGEPINVRHEGQVNPILANVESLRSERIRAGLLSVLRGAEIVNGKRFTYREIWGATVRALVGGLPEIADRQSVEEISTSTLTPAMDPVKSFKELRQLANQRFSQAIFGVEYSDSGSSDPRRNPVTRLTSAVDPMRDAVPGILSADASTGWATSVTDSFTGPAATGSPLKNLLDRIDEEDAFRDVVTTFDEGVDAAFSAVMNFDGLKDADRYSFIHWYGGYLGRLYAVANGVMAFRRDVSLWAETWYSSPTLPDDIRDGLRTLLRPKRRPQDNDSASLIPILDSRTDPVVGQQTEAKMALRTGDVDMKTLTVGEDIFLILSEQGVEIARMPLDFQLVREATACGSDRPGMTELTESTSPRLERFRAARLVPSQLITADYRVVHGDRDLLLNVAKG
ncbi:hypothetical protein ACQR35_06690 [Pseudarthrobacter sp. J1738]|uniref:hypothetical protein n=1 Tax=Pseudarthrobacter sp. J1738 TaxID=3420446 RepID=UPI003D2B2AD5